MAELDRGGTRARLYDQLRRWRRDPSPLAVARVVVHSVADRVVRVIANALRVR